MDGYVRYDNEADVLYVVFREDTVARTAHLDDLRLVDYSDDGAVLGIEFIDASSGIDLRDIPFAKTAERLIGDTGLNIAILAA